MLYESAPAAYAGVVSPLVTVCVPTFQGAPWLRSCLDSALAQTMTDLEVLVLDDASTDDTVAVAEEFAARDPRVKVQVNATRLGLAKNWNHAVASASGQWIKPLFQDDTMAPTCLERMTARDGELLVVCERRLVLAPGAEAGVETYIAGLPKLDEVFGSADRVEAGQVSEALARYPGVNLFGEPSAVLLHRSAFERFGWFNTDMIQLCDLEYWARVGSQVGIGRVREELATFQIHDQSASAANYDARQFRKDVLDVLILYHQFAFDPQYEALRRAGGGKFRFPALAARELARAERDVARVGDPGLQQALAEVLTACPKLNRPLWRLWHKLRKNLPVVQP